MLQLPPKLVWRKIVVTTMKTLLTTKLGVPSVVNFLDHHRHSTSNVSFIPLERGHRHKVSTTSPSHIST